MPETAKKTLSSAHRKALSAAQKRRWARQKAAPGKKARQPRRLKGLVVQSVGPGHALVNVDAATVRKWAYAFREAQKIFCD